MERERSPHIGNEFGRENYLFWKHKLPKECNYDGYELFTMHILHNGNYRISAIELAILNSLSNILTSGLIKLKKLTFKVNTIIKKM